MLMILNKGLATETRDVHLKVTRNLIIERERDASIITQAYKDALFMEGEIEKKEGLNKGKVKTACIHKRAEGEGDERGFICIHCDEPIFTYYKSDLIPRPLKDHDKYSR